jgi:aspartate kinase
MKEWSLHSPIYILKKNQVLLSITPKDFSFIVEENLSQIFDILAKHRVKVNVMQNSAISFSVCVDSNHLSDKQCIASLQENYTVRYNDNLELYTIRHYNQAAINRIIRNRKVLLEQKTRSTVHLILK